MSSREALAVANDCIRCLQAKIEAMEMIGQQGEAEVRRLRARCAFLEQEYGRVLGDLGELTIRYDILKNRMSHMQD